MSKNFMIGLVVVVIGLGAYYYTTTKQSTSDSMMTKQDEMMQDDPMKTDDSMMKEESMGSGDKKMEQTSRYLPYTPTVLVDAASARRVLYFYASWCPTCIPANADFEKNASMLPSDLTLIRVNYNDPDTDAEEKALATKYGITYQHTFVQIDSEGKEITKWNGGATKELLANIK